MNDSELIRRQGEWVVNTLSYLVIKALWAFKNGTTVFDAKPLTLIFCDSTHKIVPFFFCVFGSFSEPASHGSFLALQGVLVKKNHKA